MSMGIPEENIFLLENGLGVEFNNGNAKKMKPVESGMFLVDGGGLADDSESVIRERQQLAEDGMFIVVARINGQTGQLLGPPDVISRGFASSGTNGLVEESTNVVAKTLERTAKQRLTDWGELETAIRKDLSGFLSQRTRKRPIILPLIVEV